MATPYRNIAKAALMNWNGLSEKEATDKINTESIEELEGQVYAMDSVKSAIIGISKTLKLSTDEATAFVRAVIQGPEDAEIFGAIAEKASGMTPEQQLDVLETIHDGWVENNSSEKTFNKKVDRKQLRQYAPLELIGWNEAKSDLLFLSPILDAIGVTTDEQALEEAYHTRTANYLEKNQVNSPEDLANLVATGQLYYPTLPDDLAERLKPRTEEVCSQIVENWNAKDPKSAEIFNQRQNTTGAGQYTV